MPRQAKVLTASAIWQGRTASCARTALPFDTVEGSFDMHETTAGPVLVTGATGFVGSHVVEAFARAGIHTRAFVRPTSDTRRLQKAGAEVVVGALDDETAVRRAVEGTTAVVHLAALTRAKSEAEYKRVNAEGTALLARAAAGNGSGPRRFVHLSSLAAAGPPTGGRPVCPDDTPRPLTAYGRSKLAGELALLATEGIRSIVLRPPAVYGPRDRDLFTFFRLAVLGILPVPMGPHRPVQLIHAEDLAEAVLRALLVDASGIVHVAEPMAYPWETVGRMVAQAVGKRARVVRVPASLIAAAAAVSEGVARIGGGATIFNRDKARELLAPGWLCETDAAREKLGFQTRIPLAEGLKETARWYRNEGWL
jgi:nucleoside-diphosphate-sugar epimerase